MKVLPLSLMFTAIYFFALRSGRVRAWAEIHRTGLRRGWQLICGLLAFSAVACGLVAVLTERFRFYEEATVLSTVAAFHHGQPLYADPQAPVEYSLLYGPVTYFVYLPVLLGGAQRIAGYEAWALAALAATFAVLFVALRPRYGSSPALGCMALAAAIVARFTDNIWAIKADVWILLFAATGLFAALRLLPWAAATAAAFSGALLVDLKATLFLIALLPLVVVWQRQRSARAAAISGAICLPFLALLPFALHRVSLRNYLALLLDYTRRATALPMLRLNAETTLLILLPTMSLFVAAIALDATATLRWMRRRALYLGILAAACIVAVLSGAKIGGGPWHCAVLVIPSLLLSVELWQIAAGRGARLFFLRAGSPAAVVLGAGTALLLTGTSALVAGFRQRLHDAPGDTPVSMPAVESDLLTISERYAGRTLQMGYSDRAHFNLTYVRPILQLRGNPLFIDGNARNEADLTRRPVSAAVLQALSRCDVELWVIPKGGEPFSMESPYHMDPLVDHRTIERDLYPEVFRKTFQAHYRRMPSSSLFFDLWECERPGKS